MFKNIVKIYDSLFSKFKDGKFWDSWHRSALATANTQDVSDVLDLEYSPTSPEDIALFQ